MLTTELVRRGARRHGDRTAVIAGDRSLSFREVDETANRIVYTAGQVQKKYAINTDNFKPGYVTPDDHWDNRWRQGPNQVLGFSSALPGTGTGAKSLGQELGNSDAFAQCQVEKAFKAVCLRDPGDQTDRDKVGAITASFKANNYSMKEVFAETAVYCMGQ